jgi:predicted HNH restriction endonuclease
MDQSKRAFKRAEMQHELGHEDDPNFERNLRQQQMAADRGPWYIRIDGKIYKQKGIAKSFDWKRGANNYALAMIKNNPSLQGKVMLSKSAEDK